MLCDAYLFGKMHSWHRIVEPNFHVSFCTVLLRRQAGFHAFGVFCMFAVWKIGHIETGGVWNECNWRISVFAVQDTLDQRLSAPDKIENVLFERG